MNIRDRRQIKDFAAGRLENARDLSRIVLIYSALTLGLTALVTAVNYVLGLQMENLTGLSSISKRTVLSTIQSMTPLALNLFTMCLETGYLAAMLRVARGQYVSEQTLRLGFDRFWLLLRCSLFLVIRFAITLCLSVYVGIMLFLMLPLSEPAMSVLSPYLAEMSVLSGEVALSDAAYAQFSQAMVPGYAICGILCAVTLIPLWYSYRMCRYVIIDKPGMGALAVLRESKQMMRRNRLNLLKLDLSFWPYYLVSLLAYGVCYGDMILPMVGISLPGNADVWYFAFMAAYLALTFAQWYFLRSRVETAYALAYDTLKPEEKKEDGVVLGNIFQM